jgi:alpha-tubulin suppressor-like RCC1 family protein
VQVRDIPGEVEAIAAGASHGLAPKDDGTAWARGSNERSQLANGTETLGTITLSISTPLQVSDLSGVKAIAAGSDHNLARW